MNATLIIVISATILTAVLLYFTAKIIQYTSDLKRYTESLKRLTTDFHNALSESFERERKLAQALIEKATFARDSHVILRSVPENVEDQVSDGEHKQEVHEDIVANPELRKL